MMKKTNIILFMMTTKFLHSMSNNTIPAIDLTTIQDIPEEDIKNIKIDMPYIMSEEIKNKFLNSYCHKEYNNNDAIEKIYNHFQQAINTLKINPKNEDEERYLIMFLKTNYCKVGKNKFFLPLNISYVQSHNLKILRKKSYQPKKIATLKDNKDFFKNHSSLKK